MNLHNLLVKFKKNKSLAFWSVILVSTILFFMVIISGRQNCEIVMIRDGVKQTCDCHGFEITVKSTESSAERKTICIGRISNKVVHQ